MKIRAAIIVVRDIRLAAVLVDDDATYPESGALMLRRAEAFFPTLPIILVGKRIRGFSRTYATFEIDKLAAGIDADAIEWQEFARPTHNTSAPF